MIVEICIFLLIILFLKLSYNRYRFNKRLKGFVSPPGLPLLGHSPLFNSELTLLQNLLDTVKKYGRFVKIELFYGIPMLIVSDKDLINHILVQKSILTKDYFYKLLENLVGDGVITCGAERWKKTRKVLNPAFNSQLLEKYMEFFEEPCEVLIEKLKCKAENGSFDVLPYISLCALDLVCETSMGIKLNAQENNNLQYVQDTHDSSKFIVNRLFSPFKRLPLTYMFTRDYWKERKVVARIHNFTKSVVESRKLLRAKSISDGTFKTDGRMSSLLDVLLNTENGEKPMTDTQIIFETQSFLFAGYETSAYTVASCLYCLSTHSDVQTFSTPYLYSKNFSILLQNQSPIKNKVVEELQFIFGDDTRYPTPKDRSQMHYLEMVVKETLRLYSTAPFISRLVDEDISFGDVFIPKGVSLMILLYGVHKDPKYFPDPDKFDPSRFEISNGSNKTFIPFGAGPRSCIGQRLAMIETKYLVCQILRNFVILPDTSYVPQLGVAVVLRYINGVMIRLKSR